MKELPSEEDFRPLVPEYSSLDTASVMLFYLFLQVGSDTLTAFETYLADHGVSQGRFIVLLLLLRSQARNNGSGLSPSELARQAGVTRATMTGLLDGLQRKGLIGRLRHPADRRRVVVRLTSRGEESLHAIFPDYYARISELMNDLEDEEKEKFSGLLRKVKSKMSSLRQASGHDAGGGAARPEAPERPIPVAEGE